MSSDFWAVKNWQRYNVFKKLRKKVAHIRAHSGNPFKTSSVGLITITISWILQQGIQQPNCWLSYFWFRNDFQHEVAVSLNHDVMTPFLELFTDLVFLVGIGWNFLGILPTDTKGKLGWYILV
jgi:hypothetical protein